MLVLLFLALPVTFGAEVVAPANLAAPGIDERVDYQSRIEQVYWRHRIWPEQNQNPKPAFSRIMPSSAIRAKVEMNLAKERLLAEYWGVTISADAIQAELDRMTRTSKAPSRLRELFEVLDNDPAVIREILVKPLLVDRAIRERYAFDPRFHAEINASAEAALEASRGLDESGESERHLP